MKELYDRIQIELDKHRVDEWHSVIPLSEDGSSILENLSEVSYPNRLSGANGLFLHQDEQSSIEPTNAYTKTAYTVLMEDNDYIYNIFIVYSDEGQIAQITRHDKQKKEPTQGETFGVTESAIYYDENGM